MSDDVFGYGFEDDDPDFGQEEEEQQAADSDQEQQLAGSPGSNHHHQLAAAFQQINNQQLAGPPGSNHHQQLAGSPGSNHHQQLAGSPGSNHHQQLAGSPGSNHQQQLAGSFGSNHQQQLAGSSGSNHQQHLAESSGSTHHHQLAAAFQQITNQQQASYLEPNYQQQALPFGPSHHQQPELSLGPSPRQQPALTLGPSQPRQRALSFHMDHFQLTPPGLDYTLGVEALETPFVLDRTQISDAVAKQMLYDGPDLNDREGDSYKKYCEVDIRKLFGWDVGIEYDLGVDFLETFDPWTPVENAVLGKEETIFFIDHTRKATQWIKPAYLYPGMRLVAQKRGKPVYEMLHTENSEYEAPPKKYTYRCFEVGEFVTDMRLPWLKPLPPTFELCRQKPMNIPQRHDWTPHFVALAAMFGAGRVFYYHHPTQFICRREVLAHSIIRTVLPNEIRTTIFFASICVTNRRNSYNYDYVDPGMHRSVLCHRNRILNESYEHVMVNLSGVQLRKQMLIKFIGEEGIDQGGLLNEWFTSLGSLLTSATQIFGRLENGEISISRVASVFAPEKVLLFRFVGRLMAMSLVHEIPLGVPFCKPLMRMIHSGKKLTIEQWNSDYWDDPDRPAIANMTKTTKDDYGFPYTWHIPTRENILEWMDGENNYHKIGGRVGDVAFEDLETYQSEYTVWRFTAGRENVLAIRQGIGDVFPLEMLSFLTLEQFMGYVCGVLEEIDVQAWRNHTHFAAGVLPRTQDLFWQYIDSVDDNTRRNVLQFVTGKRVLPAGGFEAFFYLGRMAVNARHVPAGTKVGAVYPEAHTCSSELDLPNYTTLEELTDRMTEALAEDFAIHLA